MERIDGKVERVWEDGSRVPELARLAFDDLISRLLERKDAFSRYQVLDEIGRGGMGRVLRVVDLDMHRELAMKVLRHADRSLFDVSTPSNKLQLHARFLEEAQVAGQLDHPGIAPVHDIGLDADGNIYFTMKLVRGRTLQQVIEMVARGEDNWSETRVLNVIMRVCEAMSYAHERGVLHRDLKPANVMVGSHGEVYVMDWGLARVRGRADPHAPIPDGGESDSVRTARTGAPESGALSAFLTEDGRVLGTPTYMSPEQASGDSLLVTVQSDVYSVGAMLYQALTGLPPYTTTRGEKVDNRAAWLKLQLGPPRRIAELRRNVPPELIAITEKAMERDVGRRYASMTELADDLRAFLELRVVRAYRSGPLTELKKWVGRNRAAAVLLSTLVVVIVGAGFFSAWREKVRAEGLAMRAEAHQAGALLEGIERLWPVHPETEEALRTWLASAREFVDRTEHRLEQLASMEYSALASGSAREVTNPPDILLEEVISTAERNQRDFENLLTDSLSDQQSPDNGFVPPMDSRGLCEEDARLTLEAATRDWLNTWAPGLRVVPREAEWWTSRARELRSRREPGPSIVFSNQIANEAHASLEALVRRRRSLVEWIPKIEARREQCASLEASTLLEEAAAWSEALRSIADPLACPRYEGLVLQPQIGLVPLRRDPHSGLWEFWHVLSGKRPALSPQGQYHIQFDTGLVLVLVTGGTATAGAQPKDPLGPRFDPFARATEALRSAKLAPYFLSKYEMTQGQWLRLTGEMPSRWFAGRKLPESPWVTLANPVENVKWHAVHDTLAHFGLTLPTELQWEWAARAGTTKRYGAWEQFSSVKGELNFADASWQRGAGLTPPSDMPADGSRIHVAVDSFTSNPFGFHCMLGNVFEMCLDAYADDKDMPKFVPGTGENTAGRPESRSTRGGGFTSEPQTLRVSARSLTSPDRGREDVGVRPARRLAP